MVCAAAHEWPELVAWDGTHEEFWRVIDRFMRREEIESDHAVLCEVLQLAQLHIKKIR
jgi:hypothetical protein